MRFVAVFVPAFLLLLTVVPATAKENTRKPPVLNCAVESSHGTFSAYGGPRPSDQIVLDLDDPQHWKLNFQSKRPGPSYIPQTAPFSMTKHAHWDGLNLEKFRFLSESKDGSRKVTADIVISGEERLNGVHVSDGRISMWLLSETDQTMDGIAILQCTVQKPNVP